MAWQDVFELVNATGLCGSLCPRSHPDSKVMGLRRTSDGVFIKAWYQCKVCGSPPDAVPTRIEDALFRLCRSRSNRIKTKRTEVGRWAIEIIRRHKGEVFNFVSLQTTAAELPVVEARQEELRQTKKVRGKWVGSTMDKLKQCLDQNLNEVLGGVLTQSVKSLALLGDAILKACVAETLNRIAGDRFLREHEKITTFCTRAHLTKVAEDIGLLDLFPPDVRGRAKNERLANGHFAPACEGMEALVALIRKKLGYRQAQAFVRQVVVGPYYFSCSNRTAMGPVAA